MNLRQLPFDLHPIVRDLLFQNNPVTSRMSHHQSFPALKSNRATLELHLSASMNSSAGQFKIDPMPSDAFGVLDSRSITPSPVEQTFDQLTFDTPPQSRMVQDSQRLSDGPAKKKMADNSATPGSSSVEQSFDQLTFE